MYYKKELSVFSLIAINITAILSLSSVAYMATIGLQSIFFFALAAISFFIPSALICAELSSMPTNDNGGVFTWVNRAFGKNTGLIAIWMEWFNNVIAFPANTAAIIATFEYTGLININSNPRILFIIMMIVMWGITFLNFLSITKIVILNIIGAIFGMLIPLIMIISCGMFWFFNETPHIHYSNYHDIIPYFSFATFALFVKVLTSYSGIQVVAFHTQNIKHPERNIPISMLVTVFIIFMLTSAATISIAAIIPHDKLSVLSGLVQAINFVLVKLNLSYIAPIISLCICFGMLSALSTWMLGPARAMQVVATKGLIPNIFSKLNIHGMPVTVLLVQVIIMSILATSFIIMPSFQAAFALLIALTSQFTVLMFIMVFLSAIKLRYSEPNEQRNFKICFKNKNSNWLIILIALIGIVSCGCGFFLGLYPPQFANIQNPINYVLLMIIADFIIIAIPFLYIYWRSKYAIPS